MAEKAIFPDLIGNDRLKALFSDALRRERGAHAYVLEGPPGSGRRTAARMIAAASLCEHRNDPASEHPFPLPCGRCLSCRKILSGKSVDVLTVSRGERATLGVEPIRAVRDSLYVTPNDGERKFYLIEDAHLMTAQAQNALLLSLEEPPSYVMFLLLCEDASLLLETVRSRAPVLTMERFTPSFTEQWLRERTKNPDPARIVRASHLAGGSLGLAKKLYEGGDAALSRYDAADEMAKLLLFGRRSDAAVFIGTLPKDRAALRQVLVLCKSAVRDVIADRRGADLLFFSPEEGVPAQAKKVSVRRAVEICRLLVRAEDDIAANVSTTTVLMSLAADCARV